MDTECRGRTPSRTRCCLVLLAGVALFLPRAAVAQGLTGALIGTVKDEQGGVLSGAIVRVGSPALIGGPATQTTNEKGQLRFPALPPGTYVLDIESAGIRDLSRRGHPHRRRRHHRENGRPEAGRHRGIDCRSRERARASKRETAGSKRASAPRTSRRSRRDGPACSTSSGPLPAFRPRRRRSGTVNHRVRVRLRHQREPVPHRRHELHVPVQRRRASRAGRRLHSGNPGPVRRSVRRVRQRAGRRVQRRHQAGKRSVSVRRLVLRADGRPDQPAGTCSRYGAGQRTSGYERARYRDFTTNLGGPVVRDRLWFFAGYQYLRDYDSQPGTDPAFPRTYEQNKIFAKLTWQLAPAGSWCRAFTTSSGSTPNSRHS